MLSPLQQIPDFVSLVMSYLTGTDVARLQLSSSYFNDLLGEDRVWRTLCKRSGFRQTGTKRRHTRPWKEVYISSICIECKGVNDAIVFVDLEGGRARGPSSQLAALCNMCFTSVQSIDLRDRHKRQEGGGRAEYLLPHVKRRFFADGRNLQYALILNKIPEPTKKKKRKNDAVRGRRGGGDGHTEWDPEHNNFMLRLLKKKKG